LPMINTLSIVADMTVPLESLLLIGRPGPLETEERGMISSSRSRWTLPSSWIPNVPLVRIAARGGAILAASPLSFGVSLTEARFGEIGVRGE
jgi:hypothetical protein